MLETSSPLLLVVDFGGWYRLDPKASNNGNSSERIQHTQVSLLKDVIIPDTHLRPALRLSQDQQRHTLLYFKGAKHRHRAGVVREKLWDLLVNEPGIVMEEGFPKATGKEQSIKGMRTSEFCLHPAGDTPHKLHAAFLTPFKFYVFLSLSVITLSYHLRG